MKITAREFSNRPQLAYHKAEKGEEEVIINHDRYPGIVFVLSARQRGGNLTPEPDGNTESIDNHIPRTMT